MGSLDRKATNYTLTSLVERWERDGRTDGRTDAQTLKTELFLRFRVCDDVTVRETADVK